jgi:hypothetical protein
MEKPGAARLFFAPRAKKRRKRCAPRTCGAPATPFVGHRLTAAIIPAKDRALKVGSQYGSR